MTDLYYKLPPANYDGFRYQIPMRKPVPWQAVNWCQENLSCRRIRYANQDSDVRAFVELKNKQDLIYFMLRWL